jgi:NADH dehydrogenase FAD-containing subunit
VPTFGSRPGTGFVKSLGSGALNPRGQIKIENTFQLKSHSNIYAIGDVIDWTEQKQAAKAPKHAQIAAANILAQIGGAAPKQVYSGQPELIIITNGKVRCSSQFFPSLLFLICIIFCRSAVSRISASSGVSHWATGSPAR